MKNNKNVKEPIVESHETETEDYILSVPVEIRPAMERPCAWKEFPVPPSLFKAAFGEYAISKRYIRAIHIYEALAKAGLLSKTTQPTWGGGKIKKPLTFWLKAKGTIEDAMGETQTVWLGLPDKPLKEGASEYEELIYKKNQTFETAQGGLWDEWLKPSWKATGDIAAIREVIVKAIKKNVLPPAGQDNADDPGSDMRVAIQEARDDYQKTSDPRFGVIENGVLRTKESVDADLRRLEH